MDLREFIDSEPANAGKTDGDVFAWVVEGVTIQSDVGWSDYIAWLAQSNAIPRLRDAASTGATDSIKTAAEILLIWATNGQAVELSRSEIRDIVGPLVGAAPLPIRAPQRAALLAISDRLVPRHEASEVDVPIPISLAMITAARAG